MAILVILYECDEIIENELKTFILANTQYVLCKWRPFCFSSILGLKSKNPARYRLQQIRIQQVRIV